MPGIFNINLASLLGHRLMGWKGSAACLLGMVLPPLVILVVFATFFNDFRKFPAVESFLRGARPAIVALIALPCFQMWKKSGITLSTVWIPVGAAIGIGLLGVSPTLIILGLTLLGLLYAVVPEVNTIAASESGSIFNFSKASKPPSMSFLPSSIYAGKSSITIKMSALFEFALK